MNLFTDLPTYADEANKHITVVVDIPKGSHNKYEYDEKLGIFKLDRALHHSMYYPFDYGFIPQTLAEDGDPVDVVLLVTNPTFSGCVVKARVIGVLNTQDDAGPDPKIIAVPVSKVDPRRDDVQQISDLGKHFQDELLIFFKEMKKLERAKYDKVIIHGFDSIDAAYKSIDTSIEAFKKHH